MKYKVIASFDEFAKLGQAWSELVSHSEVNHAYMQHGWFLVWIKHFGSDKNLAIHTAWQDGQLAAAAPFHLTRERVGGIRARTLTFLSSGVTPRCNYIIHRSIDPDGFYNFLMNGNIRYDLIITKNQESNIETTDNYLNHIESKKRLVRLSKTSPYQIIDGNWQDYFNSLSKKLRQNVSQSIKRLSRDHSYTIHKITDYGDFASQYESIVRASGKSWKANIGRDLGTDQAMRNFLDDCASFASGSGMLEVWILKIRDQVGAFIYCLQHRNRLCILFVDYDHEYSYYSPGSILQYHMLEDIFRRDGVWEYDMCGQVYDYKLKWVDKVRDHVSVISCPRTIYGGVVFNYNRYVYPHLKKYARRAK